MNNIIRAVNICKCFYQGLEKIEILKNASFSMNIGQSLAIVGKSGSGKSTLMQIIGLLDKPDSGSIFIDEIDYALASDQVCTKVRNTKIGFIYQFHHLLPEFTAVENVAMPLIINGISKKDSIEQSKLLLQELGLESRFTHLPAQLSGGEQQRVAIARALVNNPQLLLCDEPTGNLDNYNASKVMELFTAKIKEYNLTTIVVTHDQNIANQMDKLLILSNGKLEVD